MKTFHAIAHRRHLETVFLQEIGHDFPESGVIFEQQNFVAGERHGVHADDFENAQSFVHGWSFSGSRSLR